MLYRNQIKLIEENPSVQNSEIRKAFFSRTKNKSGCFKEIITKIRKQSIEHDRIIEKRSNSIVQRRKVNIQQLLNKLKDTSQIDDFLELKDIRKPI